MSSLIVEVCEIKDIQPHPNADRLEIATVKGWSCIVQKESYETGDVCVFFPPDSVLPEWLIDKYNLEFLKKGGRVGTLKLRGYISQGLILPIMCLASKRNIMPNVGDNVAEILGVTKYEPPQKHVQAGKVTTKKVQNPHFSRYTDIENVQNFPDVFKEGDIVVITEKIHGSNIRFGWLPIEINWRGGNIFSILRSLFRKYVLKETHEFVYGSHNVQLQWDGQKNFYDKNIYSEILKRYDLSLLPKDHIFYGEVYGKGVQELEYGCDNLMLAIYDIKLKAGNYADWSYVESVCQYYKLPIVPVVYFGEFSQFHLEKHTSAKSVLCDDISEGCVVKTIFERNHPRIGRMILKSINPEYLARKNRTEYH